MSGHVGVAEERETERDAVRVFLADRTPETFRALFAILYPKLIRYFLVHGMERPEAEELTQDVLMAVFQKAGTLREADNFFGWFFRIAHNQMMDRLRLRKRTVETLHLDDVKMNTVNRFPPGAAGRGEEFSEWMQALEPTERRILTLRYVEELGYREIADALRIPIGTVKWKIFHAKEQLTQALSRLGCRQL